MKKLMTISAIVLAALVSKNADAQVGVSINVNLGKQRPVVVAPAYADDYYYLPEVEAYYSVAQHLYYYMDGSRWASSAYLPGRYRNYDWRTARRFEVHAARPYLNHNVYRSKFGGFGNNRYNDNRERYSRVIPNRGYDNNRKPDNDRRWDNDRDRGWGNDNDRHDNRGYDRNGRGRN